MSTDVGADAGEDTWLSTVMLGAATDPTIKITSPANFTVVNYTTPTSVTVSISVTNAAVSATGYHVKWYLDGVQVTEVDTTTPFTFNNVPYGQRHLAARLVAADGSALPNPESLAAIYVRVIKPCATKEDCADGLVCSAETCVSNECRYGLLSAGTGESCCDTPLECPYGDYCIDNKCLECVSNNDCDDGNICTNDWCDVTGKCIHDTIAGCCLTNEDCNDSDWCTSDSCDVATNTCTNAPIDDPLCCNTDEDCKPDDPCVPYMCYFDSTKKTSRCRFGPPELGCCTDASDCNDYNPCTLNLCNFPDVTAEKGQCIYEDDPGQPSCCVVDADCNDNDPSTIDDCVANSCENNPDPLYCALPTTSNLVINEIMLSPGDIADAKGEWIELYNTGTAMIDLTGYRLETSLGGSHIIATVNAVGGGNALKFYPGTYIVLARVADKNQNGGFTPSYQYGNAISLPDPYETGGAVNYTLTLKDNTGAVVDQVTIDSAQMTMKDKRSMELRHMFMDNSDGTNWRPAGDNKNPANNQKYGNTAYNLYGSPKNLNKSAYQGILDNSCVPPSTAGECAEGRCGWDSRCFFPKAETCCTVDTDCNDYNACTIDACDTATKTCKPPELKEQCCTTNADCNDLNPCNIDRCIGNICRYSSNIIAGCCVGDADCDDGDVCTVDDCDPVNHTCQPPVPVVTGGDQCCNGDDECDDGDPSTIDMCDTGSNLCTYPQDPDYCTSVTDPCDDGNVCTTDSCDIGLQKCQHLMQPGCCTQNADCADDGDPCTLQVCDIGTGTCTYPPKLDCCLSNTDCDDGKACTQDTCSASNVCHNTPILDCCITSADCNDNVSCTTDSCVNGTCQYENTTDCCEPGAPPSTLSSVCGPDPDGPATCFVWECTTAGQCNLIENSVCCETHADCNDGDACTTDFCHTDKTCRHVATDGEGCCSDSAECADQDGNSCTVPFCDAGHCTEVNVPGCVGGIDDGECQPGDPDCDWDGGGDTGGSDCTGKANGTPCSDGNGCTVNDVCTGGVCVGATKDCSALDSACTTGVCSSGACTAQPKNEGGACSDGDSCTTGDVCTAGVCGGAPNPACASACEGKANGTPCDDGDPCTVNTTCIAGACSGAPKDCSALNGACTVGTCNPANGACQAKAANEGATCNDGISCTSGDTCKAGVCSGVDVCSDPCLGKADGTPCEDGNLCTTNDTCKSGVCGGNFKDCSALTTACSSAACNPVNGLCENTPVNSGAACSDGEPCTTGDKCVSGQCVGTADPVCSATDCATSPDGTACDDGDPCTVGTVCSSGACVGQPKDCSYLADACATGQCNATTGACERKPANAGASCDDGKSCTTGDTCSAGQCVGGTLDPACDDTTAPNPCLGAPNGTACEDGSACTVGDTCQNGICKGTQKNCSALTTTCTLGVCEAATGACTAKPVNEGVSCNDGISCTAGDTCQLGSCVGHDVCTNPCLGQPDGTACEDGNLCTLNDACVAGQCVGSTKDCSHLHTQCTVATCEPTSGQCVSKVTNVGGTCQDGEPCTTGDKCTAEGVCAGTPDATCSATDCSTAPAGSACDDGDPCTVNTYCSAGACVGEPKSCGYLSDACGDGVCDAATGDCTYEPLSSGGSCDDGVSCTTSDVCTDGVCAGVDSGICDDTTDPNECEGVPNGTACDDGSACTVGDACQAGVCVGTAKDCSKLNGTCTVGACDAATGLCEAIPSNDGGSCNDGEACTTGDVCQDGFCAGELDPVCASTSCATAPAGSPCWDGNPCTVNTTCQGGTCTGTAKNCTAFTDTCNTGVCDAATGACVTQPKTNGISCDDQSACTGPDTCSDGICDGPTLASCVSQEEVNPCAGKADGTACDDGDLCTQDDACVAGVCQGSAKTCSHLDDTCATGVCNAATGQCVQQPANQGGSCSDGNACTTGDKCQSGVCVGGTYNSVCGQVNCATAAAGTACDDGNPCTLDDSCQAGVCTGSSKDCSAFGDGCNEGVCNTATGACTVQPANEGGACDDGVSCTSNDTCTAGSCYGSNNPECANNTACGAGTNGMACNDAKPCTINDVCSNGACVGTAKNCSGAGDSCNTGSCDPATGVCKSAPANNGASCNDQVTCTSPDTCLDGECTGPVSPTCANQGTVNPCEGAADGTPCEDGSLCTTGDQCVAGACVGTAKSCSQLDSACAVGVCDGATGQCTTAAANNGASCNDGEACTYSDVCHDGQCVGAVDPVCASTDCATATNGTPCWDGNPCTVNTTCQAGACVGATKDCSAYGDTCSVGVCNSTTGACEAAAANEGGACDDGVSCTTEDTCWGGTCYGSQDPACANNTQCGPGTDGLACVDSDPCTVNTVCQAGACVGPQKSCSAFNTACTTGVCNPGTGACEGAAANQGKSCSDGDTCTTGDMCNAGECVGTPGACATVCDGKADGTPCDDGKTCTDNATCQAGVCIGEYRDCSALTTSCQLGVCDTSLDACVAIAANEGGACDDGISCTTNDVCSGGGCTGTPDANCVGGPPTIPCWIVDTAGYLGPDEHYECFGNLGSVGADAILTSPGFNPSGADSVSVQVSLAWAMGPGNHKLTVLATTNPNDYAGAETLGIISLSGNNAGKTYAFELSNFMLVQSAVYVGFRVDSDQKQNVDVSVDDFVVAAGNAPFFVKTLKTNKTYSRTTDQLVDGGTLSAVLGESKNKLFWAHDVQWSTQTLSFELLNAPDFVTIDTTTRLDLYGVWQARILAKPTQSSHIGTYDVVLRVTDGAFTSTVPFKVTVGLGSGFVVWTPAGVDPTLGDAIATSLAANSKTFQRVTLLSEVADWSKVQGLFITAGGANTTHVFSNDAIQPVLAYLDAGGRVYMEGSKTFAEDAQTQLHSRFRLVPTEPNAGLSANLTGVSFHYTRSVSYTTDAAFRGDVDAVAAALGSTARPVLRNKGAVKDYAVAIAHEDGATASRTYGTTALFGRMSTAGSTPDQIMADILKFFEQGFGPCAAHEQCWDGRPCTDDLCSGAVCQNSPKASCSGCLSDTDCTNGQVCDATGACVTPPGDDSGGPTDETPFACDSSNDIVTLTKTTTGFNVVADAKTSIHLVAGEGSDLGGVRITLAHNGVSVVLKEADPGDTRTEMAVTYDVGSLPAAGSMNDFNGTYLQGDWLLVLEETQGGAACHTLTSWDLFVVSEPPPVTGCTTNADCDNGQFCDGVETCNAGTCVAGAAPSCNDGNTCSTDVCDPAGNNFKGACDNSGRLPSCAGLECSGKHSMDAGDGGCGQNDACLGGLNGGEGTCTPVCPTCAVKHALDLATPIQDFQCVTEFLTINSGDLYVDDIWVKLDVKHSRLKDLTVRVYAPNDAYVTVIDGQGGLLQDFHSTFDLSNPNTVDNMCALGGINPDGVWKVQVCDNSIGGQGTLQGASLWVKTTNNDPGAGQECSNAIPVLTDDATYTLYGNTECRANSTTGSCSGMGGHDTVYTFTLTEPKRVTAILTPVDEDVPPQTAPWNAAVYFTQSCAPGSTHCVDAAGAGGTEILDRQLAAGTWFAVVDAALDTSWGKYKLALTFQTLGDDGETCDEDIDCGTGHCQNGFCCTGGDCCAVAADCPASYTEAAICSDIPACQGYRKDPVCNASVCGNTTVADDTACTVSTQAKECGLYPDEYCTGAAVQTEPMCATDCGADSDCIEAAFCNASGQCAADQGNGIVCDRDSQCASGFCVDGVCCDGGCGGLCESCIVAGFVGQCRAVQNGQDPDNECAGTGFCGGVCDGNRQCTFKSSTTPCGTCTRCSGDGFCNNYATSGTDPDDTCGLCQVCGGGGSCVNVAAGQDPLNECATSAQSTCGNDGTCDGGGACRKWVAGTECVAQSCTNGTVDPTHTCDGAGTCQNPADVFCGGFACTGADCKTSCTGDTDCISGYFCSGGSCLPKKAPGVACSASNQCQSGFCVDGVCCNQACGGTCRACNLAGSVGTCVNHSAGTDPESGCSPYFCTGTGPSCATTCSSDSQCQAGFWCDGTQCQPKKTNGTTCSGANQCTSGFCNARDGVCCDTSCDSTCTTCKAAGSEGTCKMVGSGQDPYNECTGTGTCGGVCNGAGACSYPTTATSCGTCKRCNGAGACSNVPNNSDPLSHCGGCQTCNGSGACKSIASGQDPKNFCTDQGPCGLNGQCNGSGACGYYAAGYTVVAASCNASTNIHYPADVCNGSGGIVDGGSVGCAPYACGATTCKTSCTQHSDCASGHFCDLNDSDLDGNKNECLPKKSDGQGCSANAADYECSGGECSNGYCCGSAGAACCATNSHCGFMAEAPKCNSVTSGGCSGSRVDATCSNNVCVTTTVSDASACVGQTCQAASCSSNVHYGTKTCQPGGSCSGTSTNCNDGNVCTIDSCTASTGCSHTNNGAYSETCYDGPAGTAGVGQCKSGTRSCVGGNLSSTCSGQVLPTTEVCGGGDENCNGVANEENALNCTWFRYDNDGDGVGVSTNRKCLCAPTGKYTAPDSGATDCNDSNAGMYPGNTEKCSTSYDDNCNGAINEQNAQGCTTYFYDVDGDGYGVSTSQCHCGATGYYRATVASDCNDSNYYVNPGRPEICNGIDDNCNGGIDTQEVALSTLCPNPPNAQAYCAGGSGCQINYCASHWYNVDGVYSNGCEVQADAYDRNGQGNSCATAVNFGTLWSDLATTGTGNGNIVPAGDSDWYTFFAYAWDYGKTFHMNASFVSTGDTYYRFDIYRGSCSALVCSGRTSYDDYTTHTLGNCSTVYSPYHTAPNRNYAYNTNCGTSTQKCCHYPAGHAQYYVRVYRSNGTASPAGNNYSIRFRAGY